jgi:hypothetical protein
MTASVCLVVRVSWLQIQRSGFDSWRYQIFWKVVGLERGPFCLMSTIEKLFGRKSSSSGLENRDYGCRGSAMLTTQHPLSTKVGTNFADDRQWLGIVRAWTGYVVCLLFVYRHEKELVGAGKGRQTRHFFIMRCSGIKYVISSPVLTLSVCCKLPFRILLFICWRPLYVIPSSTNMFIIKIWFALCLCHNLCMFAIDGS